MFTYNITPDTATYAFRTYTLYGHQVTIPITLLQHPIYTYDDYVQELKERLRATSQVARESKTSQNSG